MFNFQWLILRLSAMFVFLSLFIDVEIIILISGFLFLHINMGLQTIIYDYVHIKKIKFLCLLLIRISAIELTGYILELLI